MPECRLRSVDQNTGESVDYGGQLALFIDGEFLVSYYDVTFVPSPHLKVVIEDMCARAYECGKKEG